MAKKNPIKNYDPSINFRLSKELKKTIEEKAQSKNLTTSNYVRDLLESVHNGDYCYKEQVKDKICSFLFSKEFMQLMIWIYTKKITNEKTEKSSELERYIKTLKKIDGHLPDDLVIEFDKVLMDIINIKAEDNSYTKFTFHSYSSNDRKTFKLDKVEKFLLNDINLNMYANIKGTKKFEAPQMKGV